MAKKLILTKRLINSILLIIFFSSNSYSYILDGTLKGNDLKFRNIVNKSGTYATVADWMPAKNLLPASKWSPGFRYKDIKVKLTSQDGKTIVDVSDAISVVGMEFRSNADLDKTSTLLSGNICNNSISVGMDASTFDDREGIPCHSEETYDAKGKMPFYFMRPIFDINSAKIVEAFSAIPDIEKQESIYSFTTTLVTPYFFEMNNGVETWRNITSILNISINYQPGFITNIRLKNPNEHNINFYSNDEGDMIEGFTNFTVIADGAMPQGLILTVPDTNQFVLTHIDPDVENPQIPITVDCRNCSDITLVEHGEIQIKETVVQLSGSHIEFPITVKVKEHKNNVSLGDYRGNFVLNFGLNL